MPLPVAAAIGGIAALGGAAIQSSAISKGSKLQKEAADQAVAEQRRQFDQVRTLLQPYADAGTPALRGLLDLAGLSPSTTNWRAVAEANPEIMAAYQAQQQQRAAMPAQSFAGYGGYGGAFGGEPQFSSDFGTFREIGTGAANIGSPSFGSPYVGRETGFDPTQNPLSMQTLDDFVRQYTLEKNIDVSRFQDNPQARAVAQLEQQPLFQALARQGEDAILQNASATGGIRGGNTQGALARFRPQLLNQFFQQQYARLAGITELGQNAAAGVGNAGLSTGANISNILTNNGSAQAAAAGAQGQVFSNAIGSLGGLIAGGFGGAKSPAQAVRVTF